VYRSRRDTTLRTLEKHFPEGSTWTHPRGGFYVWATIPGADTRALLPEAVERKVAYVPGTAFYPDGSGTESMRIAYCYPPDDAIEEGLKRIGALLAERAPAKS
jgi:DNA-binding transcriptional MocR family regulator